MNQKARDQLQNALPLGLPDDIYASWVGAMSELRRALKTEHVNDRYQFCCGYLQALADSRLIEPRHYGMLRAELLEIWITATDERGRHTQ